MVKMANASLYGNSIELRTREETMAKKYGERWDNYRALWDAPMKKTLR